jgi:hypothetical protein
MERNHECHVKSTGEGRVDDRIMKEMLAGEGAYTLIWHLNLGINHMCTVF